MTTVEKCTARGLSQLMRDGSKADHVVAEGSPFVSRLVRGELGACDYARYLGALHPVYAALEQTGRTLVAHSEAAAAVVDPALERLDAIEADLRFWGATPIASAANRAYVRRIHATENDPLLYIAHHYTRYLGDLSGGKAIGRAVRDQYGLDRHEGASFYDFPGVPRPKPYKDAYRARIDALALSTQDCERVVAEVRTAFRLNADLFRELDQTMLA